MARIRYIKPEFFDDEDLASTSPHARLAFAGLWTQADKEGRLKDEAGRLRVRLFPFEPQVDMEVLLGELAAIGVLVRYDVGGVRYLAIPGFEKHQRPHPKEAKSQIPPPTLAQVAESREPPLKVTASRGTIPTSTGGREGNSTGRGGGPVPPPPARTRHESILRPVPPWAIFRGERLHVPATWHERHIEMLGGADAERRLLEWYQAEDAHLVKTQTPVRDWFKWLDSRYARWVPDAVADEVENTAARELAESKARRDSLKKVMP